MPVLTVWLVAGLFLSLNSAALGRSPAVRNSLAVPGLVMPPEISSAPSQSLPTAKPAQPKRDLTWQGRTERPLLALTFDDGPKPVFAQSILDILGKYQIKATFFVVGQQAMLHPDIVYQIAAEGHELANHSYFHSRFDNLKKAEVVAELEATDQAIRSITGQIPHYFRPPGGRWDQAVLATAEKSGLRSVGWSINAGDYFVKKEGQVYTGPDPVRVAQMKERIINQLKPGAIILMHNGADETREVLPAVIEAAQAKGFRFVVLGELLDGQPNGELALK